MKKRFVLSICALFCLAGLHAQITVTGVITDDQGVPLIGANVIEKETTNGTTTDLDGNYTLEVESSSSVLVITYTGFETQEVVVGYREKVDIILLEGAVLDEIVVVGYSEQDRESLTGAVSSINSLAFETQPIASIDQLLQGQAPGLIVLGGSGQPGSDAGSVILRGPSTIQGSNSPIYILDGIQVSASDFAALNPNDIESTTILRDASSAAIYGASGANGVILITTKSGYDGPTRVTYNFQYGLATRTQDRFEMMNSTEKLAFEELAQRGPGWTLSPNNPANFGLSDEALAFNASQLDSLRSINTNWRDLIFQTGKIQQHNLSIMGGNKTSKFYISANYYDEEGQMIDSRFRRGTIRMNFEEKISDRLTVGLRTTGGFSDSRFIQTEGLINLNNPFALAYLMNPYEQIFNDDGSYQFGFTGRNPFEEAELNEASTTEFKGVGILYAQLNLMRGLDLRGRWGVDHTSSSDSEYIDPNSRLGSTTVQGNQGQLDKARLSRTWITLSQILDYRKTWNDVHNFNIIAGQEFRKRFIDNFNLSGFGLSGGLSSISGITEGSADSPDFIPILGGSIRVKSLVSYFSRINYTLNDRYNVTLGIRRDGSSVFGDNNRWGNFWNAGVSWVVNRERFLSEVDFINYLKLGVSYGTNGNSEGIAEQEKYALFTNGSYAGGTAFIPSATNPGNANLRWEVLRGFNALIEFALADNFVSGSVNYYRNTTDDLFISQELPRSAGGTSLTINAGSMKNEGIEVDLDFNLVRGVFNLNVGAQFSYNDNVITDLGQVDEFEQGTSIVREGLPLGTHYVEEWAGVNPVNGNPLYVDDDGNLTEDFNAVNPKAIYGTSIAPWSGGATLTANYRGFTLSALGSWVYGNVLFNNQTFFQENPNFAQFNLSRAMNDVWQEEGDITEIQRIGTARQFSSKDLEDGSFFRLRRLQLSYDVPLQNPLLNTVQGLSFYVVATNVFTITNFTGFDPEISNNIAQYEFPSSRNFTVGLRLTL